MHINPLHIRCSATSDFPNNFLEYVFRVLLVEPLNFTPTAIASFAEAVSDPPH